MQKAALNFSRIFVGVLFIFSGLIKANDPLGFGYKLQEYFDVFHMPWLSPFATGIAIFLCILEIVLGALLLFGFWSRKVTAGLLGIIIFFTFLTFVSAAFKVVTSCGCFGDAIPLTPWQSFSKDLVLLVLIVYLFINRNKIHALTDNQGKQRLGVIGVTALSLIFSIYTYTYLPVLDFLPYKVGQSLPEAMRIPDGAQPDEYVITYKLHHKVTGENKEMSDKDYLKTEIWKDDNWEIVGEPTQKLIKKGYEAKIKDLMISDASSTDYTKELIENPYYNLVIVAYYLKDTDEQAIQEMNTIAAQAAKEFNVRTVLLTSSSAQDADQFSKENKLMAEVFYADAVPLKSMVRSNPGLMLMKNGVVINKWSHAGLPSYETLKTKYFEQ
ncbi:BT_3928 family protein [Pedobacter antarcticus]|uniref:BT_3928 family protein n=1 Tax=Pedobacter antarcticus TaxID=34086 RepID=UPI00292D0283|nr:BT_3928 family protein [Pedobacter antarcticus]